MGGTLTIAGVFRVSCVSSTPAFWWGGTGVGVRGVLVGALLGPEGTGRSSSVWGWGCWFFSPGRLGSYRHTWLWWVGLWLLVVGLLFEICIVDASIFYFLVFLFVCKFFRAHGGCLGTRSR